MSKCSHDGNVKVFEHGNLWVYAGGWSRHARPTIGSLVLDLAGHATAQAVKVSGPLKLPHTQEYKSCTVVDVDWPDMSIPALDKSFWIGFIEDIQDIANVQGELDLLIMCFGGHGRTGTALAILATMMGHVPEDECPVEWVRENYCEEAVESSSQIKYIELITGRKCKATAGKSYGGTFVSNYDYGDFR